MILINPLMLVGAAVVVAPLLVHLLHTRRLQRRPWGAMRFLAEVVARNRRRMKVDQWSLLVVRMALLATLSLVFMRPAWQGGSPDRDRVLRQGRTAAVLLIDDSLSSGLGRERFSIDELKALAQVYLASLKDGDEVSLLRLSSLNAPPADPVFDLSACRAAIEGLSPTDMASDIPGLLRAGLAQVARHLNTNVELVLIHDGCAEGWCGEDRAGWADLRRRLGAGTELPMGHRQRPRLFVLSAHDRGGDETDVAVSDLGIDRSLVGLGRPVGIRVELSRQGGSASADCVLRLQIDGRRVDQRTVALRAGERSTLAFSHVFQEPGSHVIEAVVEYERDRLVANNRRAFAVEVAQGLPVLLVEGRHSLGLASSLSFAQIALDPQDEGEAGLFAIRRIAMGDLSTVDLPRFRVVILGDVPVLDGEGVAALERFVVGGGGLIVGLGPQTDIAHVNRFWARRGDGFLPCPVTEIRQPDRPLLTPWMASGHPALLAFRGEEAKAFGAARVKRYLGLDEHAIPSRELQVLVRLENGDPLVVERPRGLGSVILVATSLDPSWNDCCIEAAYVPFLRGLVGHLGSRILPPRNLRPGDRLAHPHFGRGEPEPQVEDPQGRSVDIEAGTWEDRPVFVTGPLVETGVYTVHQGSVLKHYAVAPDPAEGQSGRLPRSVLDRTLGGMDALVYDDPQALSAALRVVDTTTIEAWRILVGLLLLLLLAEILVLRRLGTAERRSPPPPAETPAAPGP